MNVLVDTNVWLDLILDRQPHVTASAQAVALLDTPEHRPFIGATSVTTIFYLVDRASDGATARRAIGELLQRTGVASIDEAVLRDALGSEFTDYEDAVLEQAAHRAGLDAIVTRNERDFEGSRLAIYTPSELVAALTT